LLSDMSMSTSMANTPLPLLNQSNREPSTRCVNWTKQKACRESERLRGKSRRQTERLELSVVFRSSVPQMPTWRQLYILQAQLHDEHGHTVDARQARQMIQHLDDIMTIMHIQMRTRQDGGYLPFADTLLPAQDDEGDEQ